MKFIPVEHHLPLVSVIIATYNVQDYLNGCINSVLSQNYSKIELIIIDGGSKDGTIDILKKYEKCITYWVSEPDKGIYDAWNKGLKIAQGEWISFLGADDIFLPNAINNYVEHIINHSLSDRLHFVSSKIDLVRNDLSYLKTVGSPWNWELFKKNMITWHVGCFHSKNFFKLYGTFDINFKICGDYELLLRPKNNLLTSFVELETVKMRIGGVSTTKLYQSINETYLAKIKNGILNYPKAKFLTVVDYIRIYLKNF